MAELAIEIKRAEAAGDKRVNGFEGSVRNLDNIALEVGDEWTFPDKYEVWNQKIGDGVVQYIFVDINGTVKKFYPSTFTKSRGIVNESGEPTGKRVHTEGTAADLYRSFGSVEDAMNALKGKKVKVTDMVTVRTLRYGTTTVINTLIPTIDLVKG